MSNLIMKDSSLLCLCYARYRTPPTVGEYICIHAYKVTMHMFMHTTGLLP